MKLTPGIYWMTFNGSDIQWYLELHEIDGNFALIGWTEKEPWEGYFESNKSHDEGQNWKKFHEITDNALEETTNPAWFNVSMIRTIKAAKK